MFPPDGVGCPLDGVGVGCPPVPPPCGGGAQCSGDDGVVGPDGDDGVPGCVCDGGVVVGVPGAA
jgi:hypothetical protein